MKIILHIGTEATSSEALQATLDVKRNQLLAKAGVLFPSSPGKRNHARLYMAMTDPDQVDPLRFNRGFITAERQATLQAALKADLEREITAAQPRVLLLSAGQLAGGLSRTSELERLRDLLRGFSDDISVVMHVGPQTEVMLRAYMLQLHEGRGRSLALEQAIPEGSDWRTACLSQMPEADPLRGIFPTIEAPLFWLDYEALQAHWESVFGPGSLSFRPHDAERFASEAVIDEIRDMLGTEDSLGRGEATPPRRLLNAPTLARARQMNSLLQAYLAPGTSILPRKLWSAFLGEVAIEGPEADPAALSAICARFAPGNARLVERHPALSAESLALPAPGAPWQEPDPLYGYRPSQYFMAMRWRIERATRAERAGKIAEAQGIDAAPATPGEGLSETARAILPPGAVVQFDQLSRSPFAPHNNLGQLDETALLPPYSPAPPRSLPAGSSGRVAVGCMKNEAPYILEWVAYHRAIGFDNFLIYTNGCTDGTDEILTRLMQLGVLEHRDNDGWQGNSPQQWALDCALEEPVIRDAEWIAHFDVDEFVNVRCGNGTLDDFFAHAPEATNIAMTWRLFGHNGVTQLSDEMVIAQFDHAAPKYCPKPHTAWGFKTMFRNIGAYQKISCHRTNKLRKGKAERVQWVNGSGQEITREVLKNGWRNSRKSIGYDLLQLNHYALRSAESYLIKRQRGRALHVDRSIGLNYWVRMDWSDHRDITIQRNIPRVRAEMERLLQDDQLRQLHRQGLDWHRAKAAELHAQPEFQDLYHKALALKLTETERAAYALALDVES
ncbi:Glycosyl transferase family 2 [Pseudooceanicola antarcticus]|uniref:Glycosyl transferase family 2 n=1 Tax=Pseudooceanicola antarcticus TaxID=1247613 RepID=A0A285J1H1_9RHOB|nr:glycosyltransferase family 2 protein [Pseudooceanicola antarcticus]PJE29829.1 glycosyltransferase family 2 protein [Pseudooceanicola antarcticus]SNY54180.1 Glycosyl transferase family 2 [Pseudooceanicola antarcticus]